MGEEYFNKIKEKYNKSNNYVSYVSYEDIGILINIIETLNKRKNINNYKDVTKKYEKMINSFECDFNLPFNYNDFSMFDDLHRLIENKNERLIKDIELLQELSFGLRYGYLKIFDDSSKWRE